MGAVLALATDGVRRRWLGLVAILVVLAVGLGIGLTSLEIADRTERAYPDYLRDANVAELVVNPSYATSETEDLIRSIPGVEDVTTDALLTGAIDGHEQEFALLQGRTSADGRYVTQDRPLVQEGRMIRSGAEVFLSAEAAEDLDVGVGDTVPVTFYNGNVEPISSVELQVVGVGLLPDEILPEELYPRERMLISEDVGAPVSCLSPPVERDDPRPLEEIFAAVFPADCAQTYQYFSIQVAGGDDGAVEVADQLRAIFQEENQQLPAALQQADIGYELIVTFRDKDEAQVQDSLAPVIAALRAFGAAAVVVTLVVTLLLAVRMMRRREGEATVWRSLGVPRGGRTMALGLPLLLAGLVGATLAWLLAWLGSAIGPIASAAQLVPDPPRGLSGPVLLVLLGAVVVFLAGVALAAWRVTTPSLVPPTTRPRRWLQAADGRPALGLGLRAALRSRGAAALLVGVAAAVAAVTATLVFSTSLVAFVDTPSRFGWNFEAAYIVGAGYGQAKVDEIHQSLDDRDDVDGWALGVVSGGLSVEGEPVPFLAGRPGFEEVTGGPEISSGRAPRGANEIAVGAVTARRNDLHVGDHATVTTEYGEIDARVTGIVVMPAVGPFQADRAGLGTGVYLPAETYEAALGDAEERTGQTPAQIADGLAGLVVVDLAAGVDPDDFLDDARESALAWDPFDTQPVEYGDAVRPSAVIDVATMRGVPLALAGAFALVMAVSVFAGIAAGTRARRRELAILRAVGGTRGQRRASVRWHALAVVGVGLVVGMPIGIACGRTAFTAFAEHIGAAPDVTITVGLLLVVIGGSLVLGLLAAALPGRRAAGGGDLRPEEDLLRT